MMGKRSIWRMRAWIMCVRCAEKGGESGEVEVKTKPVEEEKEEVEKEEGLEAMIRVGVNGENEG